MAKGGCRKCGRRTTNPRLCRDCQLDERYTEESRRLASAEDEDEDDQDDEPELPHECTACGAEYETAGDDPCPECGSRRRRYVGPLPGEEGYQEFHGVKA